MTAETGHHERSSWWVRPLAFFVAALTVPVAHFIIASWVLDTWFNRGCGLVRGFKFLAFGLAPAVVELVTLLVLSLVFLVRGPGKGGSGRT